jgi:hypothetical protein
MSSNIDSGKLYRMDASESMTNANYGINTRLLSRPASSIAGTLPSLLASSSLRHGRGDHSLRAENLTVVTAVSNPVLWRSRTDLYRNFEKHILDSGAKMVAVECVYGDNQSQIAADPCVKHVVVRASGRHKIWVKENLLNIGIAASPDARYFATLDADIEFQSITWAIDTLAALQHYHVIQPWSYCYDLGPDGEHMTLHRSFADLYYKKGAVGIHQGPNSDSKHEFGHPGYAWAWTREALDMVGGLIETAALGAADHHMALALIGKVLDSVPNNLSEGYKTPLRRWEKEATRLIAGHIGALNGTIKHFWHGGKDKRAYISRWDILHRNQFDPATDMKRNTHGVWELSGNKPQLSHDIDVYFRSRDEDSNTL